MMSQNTDIMMSRNIVLVQEEQQAQGQASEALPGQEQAVDKTSSLPLPGEPKSPAALPDSAAALLPARAEEDSGSQEQMVADRTSGQEVDKPVDVDQADPGCIPPGTPAMADLYHHGDLGPSARLGGSGETFCLCR